MIYIWSLYLGVANYHNIKETKKVGSHIKKLRTEKGLSIEDVSAMSGFTRNTIKRVEDGGNSDTSHLIEIAKAIGVHPMELFNVPFDIKPRFKLSPQRIDKVFLTRKIYKILKDSSFFSTGKMVKEVVAYLGDEEDVKVGSVQVSLVLQRMVEAGKMKAQKVGRNSKYSQIK